MVEVDQPVGNYAPMGEGRETADMNAMAANITGQIAVPAGAGLPAEPKLTSRALHAATRWWEGYLIWHNRETARQAMRAMVARHRAQRKL
ncbi:MAG: hypothetical protein VX871_05760 [Pseudomonadota bacterium]|nr:hypothetical protein [Pseudomonadota bacterium]